VIQNGLKAPRSVRDATHELFEDLDVTKQFVEERIREAPESFVSRADMEAAIRKWMGFVVGDGDRRVNQILDGLKAQCKYDRRRVESGERPYCFIGVELAARV
jgi:hypothetical protein